MNKTKSPMRWGVEADPESGSVPIPASIPKKFDKYIMDCDRAAVEDGHIFVVLRGMAFRDANTENPSHCMSRKVGEIKELLRFAEVCECEHCRQSPVVRRKP